MNIQKRADELIHGEKKLTKQFMITAKASELIDQKAEELGISRSETLERAIRNGGLDKANDYIPDKIPQEGS